MIDNNMQSIMNGQVYTVPVVFHIIHLGEPVGSGSNISEAQVLQALADLNSDFRDYPMLGNDVEIEFCLAQRDPQNNSQFNAAGDNITGIQRVNGTGIGNFENVGMTRFENGNEVAVKALSNWPHTDYLNVWVVHVIDGPPIGFATFPVADDSTDGITLEAIATGTPNLSKVISHEAGHFFDLYHTFEGSAFSNMCPPNDNCEEDGDMLCDTKPHPFMGDNNNWFPCDESQYLLCDAAGVYDYNITENHMNYTDNDCRNEFTSDQVMHMRCALMTLRPTLITSLGCLPGCTDVVVDFTSSATYIEEGMSITFTNASTNAITYLWEIDDQNFTTENLLHTFTERGVYDVCLTASNPLCTNRKCIEVKVIGPEPCYGNTMPCDLLLNGDFDKTNFLFDEDSLYQNIFDSEINDVCDWSEKSLTPDLVYKNGILACKLAGLRPQFGLSESIVTDSPLHFEAGKNYILEFDYLYAAINPDDWELSFKIGLAPTNGKYIDYSIDHLLFDLDEDFIYENEDAHLIWKIYTPSQFSKASLCISFEEDTDGHLFFSNEAVSENSDVLWLHLKDIKLTCKENCIPLPDFTFDEDCPNTFVGSNAGDGDIYQWEFLCDGFIANGPTVTRDFPAGTECEVCLTISCDLENSATTCQIITVPENIPEECMDDCVDLNITAETCEQSDNAINEYITNFTITVPKDSGPCGDQPLQSSSTAVGIDLVSYSEAPATNNDFIDIHIGMVITTPPYIDLTSNSVAAGLTLCDLDGNIICYDIRISGGECENCFPIEFSGNAECVDENPADGIYIYTGSIDMTSLPGGVWSSCNYNDISSEVEFMGELSSSTPYSYDFNLSTTNENISNFSSLLCFTDEDDVQWCAFLTINIPAPCPPTPTECIEEWIAKDVGSSCEIVGEQIKYNFTMSNLLLASNSLQLCHGNMWASIEGGGNAVVDSGSITGNIISFDIDIFMPCDYDQDQESYELRIQVCDENGDFVCLLFPLIFPKCSLDCGEDSKRRSAYQSFTAIEDILISPNPASHSVNIFIPFLRNNEINRYFVDIYDPVGRLHKSYPLVSGNTKINLYEIKKTGLFFVKISNHSNPYEMSIEKLFIENR